MSRSGPPPLPQGAGRWVAGARPRTLPAAVVPVAVGAACAVGEGGMIWWRVAAALVVSLGLQVGTNYANDYSDGVRGTDTARVGPVRLVASGLAPPKAVKRAALLAFGVAALAGLALAIAVGPILLLVGAAAIAAGWFYTGGPKPYGYYGFGELFVFVFFGLVATAGTTYAQVLYVPQEAWLGGAGAGLLACAVLLANNLRDLPQDRAAGKRTLTVLIGKRATQWVFSIFVLLAFAIAVLLALVYPIAWLALMALLAALPAILIVWTYRLPKELLIALALTSFTSLAYGAALCWAFVG